MAEPLTTSSNQDTNGYLQELISSLKEESSDKGNGQECESAADYVTRMIHAVNDLDTVTEEENRPTDDVTVSEAAGPDTITNTDTVCFQSGETDTVSWKEIRSEIDSSIPEPCAEPTAVEPVEELPSIEDLTDEAPSESLSDVVPIEEKTPLNDEENQSEIMRFRPRNSISLIPHPTGDANTIAQLREVANLTTKDAFNAFRSKRLIGNAYVAFACAMVLIGIALFASFFGVDHPGFARFVARASLFSGSIATIVFVTLLIGIRQNKFTAGRSRGASAAETVS